MELVQFGRSYFYGLYSVSFWCAGWDDDIHQIVLRLCAASKLLEISECFVLPSRRVSFLHPFQSSRYIYIYIPMRCHTWICTVSACENCVNHLRTSKRTNTLSKEIQSLWLRLTKSFGRSVETIALSEFSLVSSLRCFDRISAQRVLICSCRVLGTGTRSKVTSLVPGRGSTMERGKFCSIQSALTSSTATRFALSISWSRAP